MSDAGSTPPPPPPPNLTPPPGYAAYEPTLAGSVTLKRVNGLRTAILILLVVYAIGALIGVAATPAAVDAARDFLAGQLSESEFDEQQGVNAISGVLAGGATIAIVVLTIIWLYRVVANHRVVGRKTSWSPGWAIGGWFVPPLIVYAVPMLVLRESWKAADATVPPGDDRWRQSPVNPIVYVWWVLYGLAPIVFIAAGIRVQVGVFSGDREEFAEYIIDGQGLTIAQGVVNVLAAIAWGLLVRGLTSRHVALTGETRNR